MVVYLDRELERNMIYGIDRAGELKELSKLSPVVDALKRYEAYRIYYREDDKDTKSTLDDLISGAFK